MKTSLMTTLTLVLSFPSIVMANNNYSCVFNNDTYVNINDQSSKIIIITKDSKKEIRNISKSTAMFYDNDGNRLPSQYNFSSKNNRLSIYDINEDNLIGHILRATLSLDKEFIKDGVCIKNF